MSLPDYTGVWKVLYDWQTMITGALAIVGASIAYTVGVIQANATRQAADKQIAAIKSSLQATTLFELMDKFDSREFQGKLKNAAKACLAHLDTTDPGVAVEDVLDFFDDVAFLVNKGALDEEMMWHTFYHWVRVYYQASEQYIINRQKREPAVWSAFSQIYPRLNALEQAKSGITYKEKLNDTELTKDLSDIVNDPPSLTE
jgi:hypothetical protein